MPVQFSSARTRHSACLKCRRGSIAILAAAFMVVVFGLLAFVTDMGFVTVSRTRQAAAADAAALAAVDYMADGQPAADAAIAEMLLLNGYDTSDPTVNAIVQYGTWDADGSAFSVTPFDEADAVRVQLTNENIQAFFGPVLSQNSYTTTTEAIAVRGGSQPRDVVMVLDCSGSMGSTMSNGASRMENAKDAAQALVSELRDEADRVGLAMFSWEDPARNRYEKTGHSETDLSFNHAPTNARVEDFSSGFYTGGTNIGGGLRAGLDVFLNDPNPRPPPAPGDPEVVQVMVLLSDGQVNLPEPYPTSEDENGVLPPPPYKKKPKYKSKTAVTKWANTIKARGIKLHIVTLGDGAYDPVMVAAASPDEGSTEYYHHIADGGNDAEELLNVYKTIGRGDGGPKLVK